MNKLLPDYFVEKEDLIAQDFDTTEVVFSDTYSKSLFTQPQSNFHINSLMYGDNLDAMQHILELGYKAKLNLIYIDPPYNSQSTYLKNVRLPQSVQVRQKRQIAYRDFYGKGVEEYLTMLAPRLRLMKKLLHPIGSIFVHVDWRSSHYVKILLDEIFGVEQFRNEIIWCYYGPGTPKMRQFNREHQSIFWYTKSDTWKFHADAVRIPYNSNTAKKYTNNTSGFGGKAADFSKGKIPEDWWSDIPVIGRSRREIADYETQKPKKLLERIIAAVTDPGDLVADFFCGSGTTGVVCESMDRKWVMCDSSPAAISVTRSRLFTDKAKPYLIKKKASSPDFYLRVHHLVSGKDVSITIRPTLRQYFSSWAIDWEYDGKLFKGVWMHADLDQDIHSSFSYSYSGKYTIVVRAIDAYGNEGLELLEVSV